MYNFRSKSVKKQQVRGQRLSCCRVGMQIGDRQIQPVSMHMHARLRRESWSQLEPVMGTTSLDTVYALAVLGPLSRRTLFALKQCRGEQFGWGLHIMSGLLKLRAFKSDSTNRLANNKVTADRGGSQYLPVCLPLIDI